MLSGSNSGDQTITLTGDVTGSGTGSFAATIANNRGDQRQAGHHGRQYVEGQQHQRISF
jgi:beta-lactamase superfamily II metal-dependent hydrolase